MIRNFVSITLLFFCLHIKAQIAEVYTVVKLDLEKSGDSAILNDLGIAADHLHWEDDGSLELFVNQRELDILASNGFPYKVLIPDTKIYADNLAKDAKTYKSNECGLANSFFTLGDIAGYHDYENVLKIINEINENYPEITQVSTIGKSHEDRDIIALKISDNAAIDESDTEEVAYYDALTHAREPLSMMSTLYYMNWLLENFSDKSTAARHLIENREMYFVLVVNPDGYEYNTVNWPNGGGGWRKNRRFISDDCYGVDINRNFNAQWEGPGSHSDNPCSDVYRGESPASEVETQAIQSFLDKIKPASAFSSHSFSQVMIDPDKKTDNPDYDKEKYYKYASELTPYSYRGYGSAQDLINYIASGTTLDYLFEAGTTVWTPEIGTIFWEPADQICGYVQEMLDPMIFISKIAGESPSYHNHNVEVSSSNLSEFQLALSVDIINKGLKDSEEDIEVHISTTDDVTITNDLIVYSKPDNGSKLYKQTAPFMIETEITELISELDLTISIFINGSLIESTKQKLLIGNSELLFADDFENGLDNWVQTSDGELWSVSDLDKKSGNFSVVDSKNTYEPDTKSSITLAAAIDLSNAESPYLIFDLKSGLHADQAILKVYASNDATNWQVLETSSNNDLQIEDQYTGHKYWSKEYINLTEFASSNELLYLKFELSSNETNWISDGVYIDDIKVLNYLELDAISSTEGLVDLEVEIYPNPTNANLYIEFLHGYKEEFEISIINSYGKLLVSETKLNQLNSTKFDISNYPTGIYFVQLQSGDQLISKKFIKK